MAEFELRMRHHVLKQAFPSAFIAPDCVTVGANGENLPQDLDFRFGDCAHASLARQIPPSAPGVNRDGKKKNDTEAEQLIQLPAFVGPRPCGETLEGVDLRQQRERHDRENSDEP